VPPLDCRGFIQTIVLRIGVGSRRTSSGVFLVINAGRSCGIRAVKKDDIAKKEKCLTIGEPGL
jgi:hypothetical protein